MSTREDRLKILVGMDASNAQKTLTDLQNRARDIQRDLTAARKAGDKALTKKLEQELRSTNQEIRRFKTALQDAEGVMQRLSKATIKEMEGALKTMQKQIKQLPRDSEAFKQMQANISKVREELNRCRRAMDEQMTGWQRFTAAVNKGYFAVTSIIAGLTGASAAMTKAVNDFSAIEEAMAGTRKFTGLTADEVQHLNEELLKLDTRSTRVQLNELAQEAGRLGKQSVEDVLGYVRAADKINVALDDLGEGATLTLSKLTGIFGDEQRLGTEQALLSVGSVINELSQNCAASAPYLAEFSSRMGGVGAQAGMTVQQIMGFASVLDANNQKVEAASTALSQVIVRLYQEPAKYAKVAGLDVEEFSKKVRTDMNGAVIELLETLSKSGGMSSLAPMFKDMGENGSRAIATLSTLAQNIDFVKEQQLAANEAYREGTSIGAEFDVQNNTITAQLDKQRNKMTELSAALGEELTPAYLTMMKAGSASMSGLVKAVQWLGANLKTIGAIIISVSSAWATYTIATKAATIWTNICKAAIIAWNTVLKVGSGVIGLFRGALYLLQAGFFALTGQTRKAKVAMLDFNLACNANVFIAIATAIATLITTLVLFNKTSDAATSKIEAMKDATKVATEKQEEARASIRKSIEDIDRLIDKQGKCTVSKGEESKICAELNSKYGTILGRYYSLAEWLATLKTRGEAYIQTLSDIAQAEALLEKARALRADAAAKREEGKTYDASLGEIILEELKDVTLRDHEARNRVIANKRAKVNKEATDMETIASGLEAQATGLQDKAQPLRKTNSSDIRLGLDVLNAKKGAGATQETLAMFGRILGREVKGTQMKLSASEKETLKRELANELTNRTPQDPAGFTPSPAADSTPYVSETQTKKEQREAAKRARLAAIKAKKEFNSEWDKIKNTQSESIATATVERATGQTDYRQYLEAKEAADKKYYDDSIALFEKWGLQEDDQYGKLLQKREEKELEYQNKFVSLDKQGYDRRRKQAEQAEEERYAAIENKSLADEIEHSEHLMIIKKDYFDGVLGLYEKGSDEWHKINNEYEDALAADRIETEKRYIKTVKELRKKGFKDVTAEMYAAYKETLDKLLEDGKLKLEEYTKLIAQLNGQMSKNLPGESKTDKEKNNEVLEKYKTDMSTLEKAKDDGLIDEKEYKKRVGKLTSEMRNTFADGLANSGNDFVSGITKMATSWADFSDQIKNGGGDALKTFASGFQATASVVMSALSVVSEFVKAQAQIEIDATEKKYDRMISMAEGNKYKTKALEEKKQKEVAELKNKASRSEYAMKYIEAVTTSIIGGLNAYASASAIPVVGTVLAPIMMAIALATGAAQVALIRKQQQAAAATGYAEGGFTKPGGKYEEAGIVHAGEWVASQKLVNNPTTRPVINALEMAQRSNRIPAMADIDPTARAVRQQVIVQQSTPRQKDSERADKLEAALRESSEVLAGLRSRLDEPIAAVTTVAGDYGINRALDDYSALMENKSPRHKVIQRYGNKA